MTEKESIKIPKFLRRLFRETSDPENNNITWNEDGDKILILDKEAFIKNTLPFLSRTKEYSAFIRQLNFYGFVKVKNEKSDDYEEYYNCYFKRDHPELLGAIKRVMKTGSSQNKLNLPGIENNISFLTSSNFKLASELAQLKDRVDKQERTINGLLDILGRVFRTGVQNINFEASAQAKQRQEGRQNYLFENHFLNKDEVEPVSQSTQIITKKEENNKKSKYDQIWGDMNDIFF